MKYTREPTECNTFYARISMFQAATQSCVLDDRWRLTGEVGQPAYPSILPECGERDPRPVKRAGSRTPAPSDRSRNDFQRCRPRFLDASWAGPLPRAKRPVTGAAPFGQPASSRDDWGRWVSQRFCLSRGRRLRKCGCKDTPSFNPDVPRPRCQLGRGCCLWQALCRIRRPDALC
jgi:hypothetical protein